MDKAPLKKLDKKMQEIQDAQIIANGAPTISLKDFIDCLLVEAIGVNNTLPTFYKLVEEDGMVVYDKVIEGQIVSSNELLRSLRHRDQQVPHDIMLFDDKDFIEGKDLDFWKTLEKESHYSILRDDVATAYCNAGESEFPWLNIDDDLVWLNVEEYAKTAIPGDFGLPAKLEDYQNAFKQDAWGWQEALCWLKGRLPNKGQLHQLPKHYETETDLIERAIKAGRLTTGSSSPKQWIDWAREKGWSISPLIDQGLPSAEFGGIEIPNNDNEDEEEKKGRRDKQINSICHVAKLLEYDLLNIPEGGKAAIKAKCLENTGLFTDAGFDHAWKEANKRSVIRMQGKEKYL